MPTGIEKKIRAASCKALRFTLFFRAARRKAWICRNGQRNLGRGSWAGTSLLRFGYPPVNSQIPTKKHGTVWSVLQCFTGGLRDNTLEIRLSFIGGIQDSQTKPEFARGDIIERFIKIPGFIHKVHSDIQSDFLSLKRCDNPPTKTCLTSPNLSRC